MGPKMGEGEGSFLLLYYLRLGNNPYVHQLRNGKIDVLFFKYSPLKESFF